MAEWFLFLPQVRLDIPAIVERARVAEASGFDGIAFIDHLEAPGTANQSIWEAMAVATWVAARTERLRIGHLVLCDAFRHPAVLAKQAVTLSAASEGRFELGLGSGSWPQEFARFDIEGGDDATARVARLGRDLALLREYWGQGENAELTQQPTPAHWIPLVLGGTRKKTMELVRQYADWWNIPSHRPAPSVAAHRRFGAGFASTDGRIRRQGRRPTVGHRREHPAVRIPGSGADLW
jgi:alkanesulfonate monooxygenase SsuD/methylene tetrahydromethanopterin reductase-like flavin-dependent oxidoreductase (luciferase family)